MQKRIMSKKLIQKNSEDTKTVKSSLKSQSNAVIDSDDAIDYEHRDEWANKVEYMLSVIGYVVDLGSEYKNFLE